MYIYKQVKKMKLLKNIFFHVLKRMLFVKMLLCCLIFSSPAMFFCSWCDKDVGSQYDLTK